MEFKVEIPEKKKQENYDDILPEHFFKPHFFVSVVAPRKSGKTCLVMNMLKYYKKVFKHIIFVSPTIYIQDLYNEMYSLRETDQQFDKWNEEIIRQLINHQKKKKENKEKLQNVLLILDDVVGLIPRNSLLNTLATRHRHFKISVMIINQLYKSIPPVARNNLSGLIIFKIYNKGELEKIKEEQTTNIPESLWTEYYETATDKPFGFLVIDYDKSKSYISNFQNCLD
jgi:hypothetical protein